MISMTSFRSKKNNLQWWQTKDIESLFWKRIKATAVAHDIARSDWAKEHWNKTMSQVYINGTREIEKRRKERS